MGSNIIYICRRYTDIYATITPRDIERLELCLRDLYTWLTTNKLKLNSSKTELLQITPLNNPPVDLSLTVNGTIIKCSDKVKNLGVLLDSKLTMVDNIQCVTRKVYCALANIGKIQRDLTSCRNTCQCLCDFGHGLCKQYQLGGPTSAHKQPTATTEHGSSYYLSL